MHVLDHEEAEAKDKMRKSTEELFNNTGMSFGKEIQ